MYVHDVRLQVCLCMSLRMCLDEPAPGDADVELPAVSRDRPACDGTRALSSTEARLHPAVHGEAVRGRAVAQAERAGELGGAGLEEAMDHLDHGLPAGGGLERYACSACGGRVPRQGAQTGCEWLAVNTSCQGALMHIVN